MIMMTPYATTSSKGKKPYKSWLKDGVNGGPSSMDVLVNWLSKKANYAKWKGGDCERIPKKLLLENIIEQMRDVGIYHRLAKDVASKISTLQSNYRLAREWKDTDGKKLLDSAASEESIHEELLKRFPYWDALHEVFGSTRASAWPMSISSIMHADEEDYSHIKEEDMLDFEDESNSGHSPIKRRRRDSTNGFRPAGGTRSSVDTTDSVSTTHTSPQSIPCIHPVTTLRPLAHVLPHHETANDSILAESLIQVTREKEAGRMKRAQDMLQFLREKRLERDQLLIEKERTKRVKARAELVRNLLDAGFDKEAIAEQLNNL